MHFFERQEKARQNTSYLVFLFFVAVAGIVAATCVAVVIAAPSMGFAPENPSGNFLFDYYNIIAGTCAITLTVILLGAAYKWMLLGNSGAAIATYMGGQLVDLGTKDPHERKLVNVVEEMSIAAGIPVPLIYIMKNEHSVNAFAAGTSTTDAVVCVTLGTIENLTRDELQGVIAHEFSHIFNGDCKLNMQLIGYLAGIVTIGLIGRTLLEAVVRPTRYRSRRRDSKGDGQALLVIGGLGLALWVIGYLGVFVGRLIRAAVSRQREFLADASAVQYTRYPTGIAGALAKIGVLSSYVYNGHAEETSHMFFDSPRNPFTMFSGAMATHPPLEARIAAIDKRFLDESFLEKTLKYPESTSAPKMHPKYIEDIDESNRQETQDSIGQAAMLIAGLSPVIKENLGDEINAQALVLALLSREAKNKQDQLEKIESFLPTDVYVSVPKAMREIEGMDKEQHIAVFELCAPTLRAMSEEKKVKFYRASEQLCRVDHHIDLVEASYLLLLRKLLLADQKRKSLKETQISSVWDSVKIVLASLAHHGHSDHVQAGKAYENATKLVHKKEKEIPPRSFCNGKSLIAAMDDISRLRPLDKKIMIEACYACVEHDGEITPEEMELLRAIAGSLEAPIPLTKS